MAQVEMRRVVAALCLNVEAISLAVTVRCCDRTPFRHGGDPALLRIPDSDDLNDVRGGRGRKDSGGVRRAAEEVDREAERGMEGSSRAPIQTATDYLGLISSRISRLVGA